MHITSGTGILDGIAIGRIHYCRTMEYSAEQMTAGDPVAELERYERARELVHRQHESLYEQAVQAAGREYAEIFRLYSEILEDQGLQERIRRHISEDGFSAAHAVRITMEEAEQQLQSLEDPYLRERSADLADIKNGLLRCLSSDAEHLTANASEEAVQKDMQILAAEDITPSDAVRLDTSYIVGIVTRKGSPLSHTAILARSMNLPALVHCEELSEEWDGKLAVLDGKSGTLYVDPDATFLQFMKEEKARREQKRQQLQELRTQPGMTKDGMRIAVCANIAVPEDVVQVKANGAEAIGLFRSEFLYLNAEKEPTEDEQFRTYRKVLEDYAPGRVVIRTSDIGADKTTDYLNLPKEENPALGCRAIRLGLVQTDFLKRQLRALLRASVYGHLEIALPMITSLWEIQETKRLLEECRKEVRQSGYPVAEQIPLGILIETPAAALCAEELAGEVDFFSIGTNDLAQYTCAADRQNPQVERFFDARHPAVLRQIQMTAAAARKAGIRVGICGEMAGDLSMTETLLRMGIRELSVSPAGILPLKARLQEITLGEAAYAVSPQHGVSESAPR